MATDGHIATTAGSGQNLDAAPSFTNSEGDVVLRSRVELFGAGGQPGNGLAVNTDGSANVKVLDGDQVTLGAKADAHDLHTDTTAITMMAVLKALSYLLQGTQGDAAARAAIGQIVHAGVNPSNTADALRTLAASGFGLGTQLVAGAVDKVSSGAIGFASLATTFTAIASRTSTGVKRRAIFISSTLNATGTLVVQLQGASGGIGLSNYIQITIPATAGGVCVITDGIVSGFLGATVVNGYSLAGLNAPADAIAITMISAASTSGAITIDLVQQT